MWGWLGVDLPRPQIQRRVHTFPQLPHAPVVSPHRTGSLLHSTLH